MKKRILFLLVVTLPIGLLMWFAYQAQINEQLAKQQQYQNLAQTQLKLIDEKIINYFNQLETVLISSSDQVKQQNLNANQYTSKIREFLQKSPYVLNVYVEDNQKNIIYPSRSLQLSDNEQVFLSKIKVLANNRSLFNNQSETNIEQQTQSFSRQNKFDNQVFSQQLSRTSHTSPYQPDEQLQHGWIVWYQDQNLQHFFWFKDQQSLYILFLDRMRIISELVALLPDNLTAQSQSSFFKRNTIQLKNTNNELVYQWGNYPTTNQTPVDKMVSYPLSSWKLSWYAENGYTSNLTKQWSIILIALLCSILFLLIMIILYREYTKEVRLAQQRVNFVSQVSHELKTPLTNIRMYAELLENKINSFELEPDQQSKSAHFLSVLLNESQRLSRLIENVLSFSKVQKQTFKINKTLGVIDQSIRDVLLNFEPVFNQKNLTVVFQSNAGDSVYFDSQIVEQILNNLLSNIEKYASQGKKVDIVSQQSNDKVIIEIRDYGPGIDKRNQSNIFKPFYRISNKLTEGVSGTGIGLTICQQLAQLHGGKIQYKTVSPGACFMVELVTEPR